MSNHFTGKTFKVNKSKTRKRGKPRTHAEYIARMREPVIVRRPRKPKTLVQNIDSVSQKLAKVVDNISIAKTIEDRSDYFLSESELAEIKAKILENE